MSSQGLLNVVRKWSGVARDGVDNKLVAKSTTKNVKCGPSHISHLTSHISHFNIIQILPICFLHFPERNYSKQKT